MGLFDKDKPRVNSRMPCRDCGCKVGMVVKAGPHLKVICEQCDRYLYFVPAVELERTKIKPEEKQ